MTKEFWTLYLVDKTPGYYYFSDTQRNVVGYNVQVSSCACKIVAEFLADSDGWNQVNVYISDWATKSFPKEMRAKRSTEYDIIEIGPPPKL